MPNEENTKAVIAVEVDLSVKETFKKWWRANNYVTESEAVRALIRGKVEEINAQN